MIRKISFKNFYSFQDSFEMSFLATKKNTFDYVQSKVDKYQISKIATIIGGNASGKTNIIRVFRFLQDFISQNIPDLMDLTSQNTSLPYQTFFSNTEIVEINLEFEEFSKIFFYTLQLKDNAVVFEQMKVKTATEAKHLIFKRDTKLKLGELYFNNIDDHNLPDIKSNFSVISFFRSLAFDIKIMQEIEEVFSRLCWQVNITDLGLPLKNIELASFLYTIDKDVFERMQDFISNFDIGLQSFNIDPKDEGGFDIKGIHGDKILDFKYESRGTQALYSLLGPIFIAMKFRGLVVIDELETGLHPEAVEKLISYFLSESEGEMCQFIFSTHSINVLNKLDREQIFIVDKNDKGESEVYRISDIENSRPDENFVKKYMSGKYGGFPKIKV